MSTIISKLNNALNLKNEYLTPNNIREGINIFGIEGTVHEGPNLSGLSKSDTVNLISNVEGSNYSYGIISIPTNELTYTGGSLLNMNYYNYENDLRCGIQTITNLDTSTVTDFSDMFYHFNKLEQIPNINTSKGQSFTGMFRYCYNLKSINNIDVSNGKYFNSMLYACYNLVELPESFNNLTNNSILECREMFYGCNNLTNIPNINTSEVTNFYDMFSYCSKICNIPNLDTSNGINFSYMFIGSNLNYFPDLDLSNAISISGMFANSNIQNLDTFNYNLSKCTSWTYLFQNCHNLSGNIDFTQNLGIQNLFNFYYTFYNTNISSVTVNNFTENSYDINFSYSFAYSSNLTDFILNNITTNRYINFENALYNATNVTNVKFDSCTFSGGYNFANIFFNIGSNFKELNFNNCIINSDGQFYCLWYYNNVSLDNFTTTFKDTIFENGRYIQPLFAYLDLSRYKNTSLLMDNFTINNISSASRVFEGLNLTNLHINSFYISNCDSITDIFCRNPYLESFSGNMYINNVNYIGGMFSSCNNLSDSSIQNIINILINSNITYRNLSNSNSYSPLYGTNISNTRYQNRWEDLTNAGWEY